MSVHANGGEPDGVTRHFLRPAMTVSEAEAHYKQIGEFIAKCMTEGEDYGLLLRESRDTKTGEKPRKILLKPGAEKLAHFFALEPSYELVSSEYDWTGSEHNGEPLFYARYVVTFSTQGIVRGIGEGSCNSWEKKYRHRNADRVCPRCGEKALLRSKDPGGGYFCWERRGGCKANFAENDPEIKAQVIGRVPNPDICELVNTIEKMAFKRAYVAGVLCSTGTSNMFTQDLDDEVAPPAPEPSPVDPPAPTEPRFPKMIPNPPMQSGTPVAPKAETSKPTFAESMEGVKAQLGSDNFHRLLNNAGFDSLAAVTDPDQQTKLFKSMREFAKGVVYIRGMRNQQTATIYDRILRSEGISDPAEADHNDALVALHKKLEAKLGSVQ